MHPTPAPRLGLQAWLLILLLSLPWAGSFIFFRLLAHEIPSLTIAFGRVAIAGVALLAALAIAGQRPVVRWRDFLVMGLLNNAIPFSLFAWAEIRITSGEAAILNATAPIFTGIVLHLFGAERLTVARMAGAVLGFIGVAVLTGADALALDGDFAARLACLGAALSYAFTALWARRIAPTAPMHAATAQCLCSAAILAPFMLLIDRPWTLPPPGLATWGALAGIALVSTAAAYVVFFRIVALAGSANVMLVTFLVPVSALAMGSLFLGEPVTPRALAGMALIAAGLAAIDGRVLSLPRRARARSAP